MGMISSNVATRIVCFEENMDTDLFLHFFKLLVKDAKTLYPDGNFRIYMDNDTKHRSTKAKDYYYDNHLTVPEDWPSCSPDLNPTENVWGLIARSLQKLNPKTIDEVRKFIRSLWKKYTTKAHCESLVDSMKNRLEEVQARLGEKIDY